MAEKYIEIFKINWKYNLLPHIIITALLCILAPFIMGVKNLDDTLTAKVLELYISLFGIILLTPLFIPDQDRSIRELLESKRVSMVVHHCVRLLAAFGVLIIAITSFLVFLKSQGCRFPFSDYLYGTIATSIFLGGMGVLVYSISDNLPVSYMIPIIYYISCYGGRGRFLGKFYLFTMGYSDISIKNYIMIAGMLMIAIGVVFRNIKLCKKI